MVDGHFWMWSSASYFTSNYYIGNHSYDECYHYVCASCNCSKILFLLNKEIIGEEVCVFSANERKSIGISTTCNDVKMIKLLV